MPDKAHLVRLSGVVLRIAGKFVIQPSPDLPRGDLVLPQEKRIRGKVTHFFHIPYFCPPFSRQSASFEVPEKGRTIRKVLIAMP